MSRPTLGRPSGLLSKDIEEFKKCPESDPTIQTFDTVNPSSIPIKQLYEAIKDGSSLTYAEYASLLDISEATVKRRISELKKRGRTNRVGSNKNGHWEVMGNNEKS